MFSWLCLTICGRWMEDWPTQGNPTDEALASSRSTINICSSIQHLFYGEVSTCIPCLFVPHKSCLKCVQTIFTATPMWEVDFKTCLLWAKIHFDAVSHIFMIFSFGKNFFLLDLSQIWAKSGSSHGCHHLDRSLPLTILYLQWPDICLHWNPSNVKIETHFFMSSCLHLEMLS